MVKKLERKNKAGIRVVSTPGEGAEAGKTKDWLARGLPRLNPLSGVLVPPRAGLSQTHEDGRGR